jgi:hypothetical protein
MPAIAVHRHLVGQTHGSDHTYCCPHGTSSIALPVQSRASTPAALYDEVTEEVRLIATDFEESADVKVKRRWENVGLHEGHLVNQLNDLVGAVH